MSAMATVCTAFQSLLLAATEFSSLSPSSMISLTAIQTSSSAPTMCRKRHVEERGNEHREGDAQQHGDACAERDAFGALLRRQGPAGERDHHRIVTRQHNVERDDLEELAPESGVEQRKRQIRHLGLPSLSLSLFRRRPLLVVSADLVVKPCACSIALPAASVLRLPPRSRVRVRASPRARSIAASIALAASARRDDRASSPPTRSGRRD